MHTLRCLDQTPHILCKVFLSFPNRSIACPQNLQVVESEKHRTGRCQGLSVQCHFIQGIWAAANFDMRRDSTFPRNWGTTVYTTYAPKSPECLFILQIPLLSSCGVWKSLSCVQFFATPWTIQSMEFSRPEYWSGQDSLSLLQGIFPTQGSNPGFQHYRRILYQLSHKGSPGLW